PSTPLFRSGRWRWHAGGPARRRRAAPPGWRAGTARTGRAGRTPPPAVHAAPGCGRRGSPRSGRAAPRTRSCARPARSTDGRAGWSSRPRLPPDGRRVRRSPPAAAGRRPWPAAGRPAPRRRHRRPPPRRTRPSQALRCPCRPSTGSGSGGVVRRHVAGGLVGAAAEQELLHLGLEEGAVIRVERREAVLVDQHGLVGEPRGPCRLADAGEDPLAKLARPRHEVETLGFALFVLAEDDPGHGGPWKLGAAIVGGRARRCPRACGLSGRGRAAAPAGSAPERECPACPAPARPPSAGRRGRAPP